MVINEFRRSTRRYLFVVGDEGISLKAVCEIMDINESEAKELLKSLKTYEDNKEV